MWPRLRYYKIVSIRPIYYAMEVVNLGSLKNSVRRAQCAAYAGDPEPPVIHYWYTDVSPSAHSYSCIGIFR